MFVKWLTGGLVAIACALLFDALHRALHPRVFSQELIAMCADAGEGTSDFASLKSVLQEPFTYLGHGTQSIAFASGNQKYVLKFFLTKGIEGKKKFALRSPLRCIPVCRKWKNERKRAKRFLSLQRTLESYRLAFQDLRSETGLLALHFHSTKDLLGHCTLLGQGASWVVDLDKACFVLQQRAIPLMDVLSCSDSAEEKDIVLQSLMRLFSARAAKGYYDLKGGIHLANYGMIEGRAVQLDPGRLVFSEEVKKAPALEVQIMRSRLLNKLKL